MKPTVEGLGVAFDKWGVRAVIVRDPSIVRGPDGVFHMPWTISWNDEGNGVSHSSDLIHWSAQQRIPVVQ